MKHLSFALVLVVAAVGAASAGPKDKVQQALVNPDSLGGTAPWDNTAVDAKQKFSSCKQQIQIKVGTAVGLSGTDLVCLSSGDAYTSLGLNAGNSLIMRGTIDAVKGKLTMKADLRAIGCGALATSTSINSTLECYVDTGWDGATECTNQGGLWIAPGAQPGTEKFKPGALEGLCQGVAFGFALTPPAGALLAVAGTHTPCKDCP